VSSIVAISALALVGFTTPALADVPAAPAQQPSMANPPAAKKAPPPAKPTLICRSQVTTGSLLPVRECHTADQWADIRTHGNDQLGIDAARPHGLGGQ
jgi:hypothetical protein